MHPHPHTANCQRFQDAGQSYRGEVAMTRGGIPCQAWDSDFPHRHHTKAAIFPELDGAGSHCRNPGQLGHTVWCYTTNASVLWDYCIVPQCDGMYYYISHVAAGNNLYIYGCLVYSLPEQGANSKGNSSSACLYICVDSYLKLVSSYHSLLGY